MTELILEPEDDNQSQGEEQLTLIDAEAFYAKRSINWIGIMSGSGPLRK